MPIASAPETEQSGEPAGEATPKGASEVERQDDVSETQKEDTADDTPKADFQPAPESADPVQVPEDSHATGSAKPDRTPSPSPDEKMSIEKTEVPSIPEPSSTSTAEPSRLNTEEFEADTKKRKRRSATPELSTQDVRAKKPRPSENVVHEVAPAQDDDTVMDQRAPEEAEKELDEKVMEIESINGHEKPKHGEAESNAEDNIAQPTADPSSRVTYENKDRYRDALKPASVTPAEAPGDLPEERDVAPALHLATPSLYIRNFMRPLRPDQLQSHLVVLASPPGAEPDPAVISSLFLDSIKTHALVRFASTSAASRARASLHGVVWPPEGNRKALWVDFIPEDDCAKWITEEEDAVAAEKEARAAGRPIPAKKFEVVYLPAEDDAGAYTAVFQEVGAGAGGSAFNPPKGPRRTSQYDSGAPAVREVPKETRQNAEQSFKTLDELFSSTVAKPKLYFLPVPDDRAETRRKELELETSRDWTPEERRKGRGIQTSRRDQKARFAFDDEDRIIEAGGDFGPWTDQADFQRGRGGDRGGYRGGYRGRGGRGGGWRSGPERSDRI